VQVARDGRADVLGQLVLKGLHRRQVGLDFRRLLRAEALGDRAHALGEAVPVRGRDPLSTRPGVLDDADGAGVAVRPAGGRDKPVNVLVVPVDRGVQGLLKPLELVPALHGVTGSGEHLLKRWHTYLSKSL
jgi:hypothetical protein